MNIKNKKFFYLLRSDIKEGIFSRIWWYVMGLPIIFLVITAAVGGLANVFSSSTLTITDIFALLYEGVDIFEKDEDISFPVIYISYMLIPFIITSYYPFNDFEGRGKMIFTRMGKRSLWWYSKCIWNIVSICIYQFTIIAAAFIYCLFFGRVSLDFSDNIMARFMIMPDNLSSFNILFYIFIVPTLTIISLSIFQMTISMLTSPVYGMMVQVCLLVMAIFIYSPLLPHNFLMIKRSHMVIADGFSLITMFSVCFVIFIFSIFTGKYVIDKKDIF